MKFVTQLKHAGAQKWELLMSDVLPAKQWMIRISIHQNAEAAHLDQPFKSHCRHQDIPNLQLLKLTFPSRK